MLRVSPLRAILIAVVAVIVAEMNSVTWFLRPAKTNEGAGLRIPEDVSWYIQDREGWLCDYKYVRKSDSKTWAIKILPRGSGLGKILVFHVGGKKRTDRVGREFIPNGFDRTYLGHGSFIRRTLWSEMRSMNASLYFVYSMDYFGAVDRTFSVSTMYSKRAVLHETPTLFEVGQEIPLVDSGGDVMIAWTDEANLSSQELQENVDAREILCAYKPSAYYALDSRK